MQSLVIRIDPLILLFLISAVLGVAVSYSKIYFFHIILMVLLMVFGYRTCSIGIKCGRYPTNMHYMFYFMLMWYALSIIWSENLFYSLEYLFYISCGLSIVLAIIYYSKDLEKQNKLLNVLGKIFIIEIIISLLEGFGIFRLPVSPVSPYVTWFGREPLDMSHFSIEAINNVLRSPTGFNWNPNDLATTMNIIFPFFLFHRNRLLKFTGIIVILTLIVFIGSRGNFIAYLAMFLLYLFVYAKNRTIKLLFLFTTILIFAIWGWGRVFYQVNNSKLFRLTHVHQAVSRYVDIGTQAAEKRDSVGVRKQLIKNGINALIKTNYIGVGGGASKAVQEFDVKVTAGIINMHNFWVEILVEGGLLFFIIFVGWYLKILYNLHSIGKNGDGYNLRYYANSCFLSLFGFIFSSTSPSSVIYLFPMWLLYGFSIATVNNYYRLRDENINPVRS